MEAAGSAGWLLLVQSLAVGRPQDKLSGCPCALQDVYCQAGGLSAEALAAHPQYLLPAQVPTSPRMLPFPCPVLCATSCWLVGGADGARPCCATVCASGGRWFLLLTLPNRVLQYLCTESAEAPLLRTVSSVGNGQDSWAVSQSRTPSAGIDTISDFVPGRLGVQVLCPAALPT